MGIVSFTIRTGVLGYSMRRRGHWSYVELRIIHRWVTWLGRSGRVLAIKPRGESNGADKRHRRLGARHSSSHLDCLLTRTIVLRFHSKIIALLVRTTFHPLLPLFTVGVDALFGNTVFDTAEAGSGVVALFACLLAIGASVLDLSALAASRLGRHHARRERVHVHWHARVRKGVYGH